MKRVKMLTTVEDSNLFTDQQEAAAVPNPRSVLGEPQMQGERFISVHRVDYLGEGEVVEVSDWQAADLVRFGHAEEVA